MTMTGRATRGLALLLCGALLPAPPASAYDRTIVCSSRDFRYRYCRADTDHDVRLVRQLSLVRCRRDDNWGYDGRGVWVDRGCQAEFRVGGGRGSSDGDKVAVGVAAAGVAIAIAIAASKHHDKAEAAWAVGTFKGFDDKEGTDVEITVSPGGSVEGRAGEKAFTGRLAGNVLEAGRYRFRIEKSGNGFLATDETDAAHRVSFQRAGGY